MIRTRSDRREPHEFLSRKNLATANKKWPQLGGKLGPKSGRNNADIGMTQMWVRNQPTPIKFGFRERPVLIWIDRY
jgi:hypothetical protein